MITRKRAEAAARGVVDGTRCPQSLTERAAGMPAISLSVGSRCDRIVSSEAPAPAPSLPARQGDHVERLVSGELERALRLDLSAASDRFSRLELSLRCHVSEVADGLAVFLLGDRGARPSAVVLCSSPAAPDMATRHATRARAARLALGPDLGRVILEPLWEGAVLGLSYVVMPFCQGLSESRVTWAAQRILLRAPVLDWLWSVAERTAAPVDPTTLDAAFSTPLCRLAAHPALGSRVRTAAQVALARLSDGVWTPRQVLMHGDLWKGNILIRPPGSERASWTSRFVVIDWPGSLPNGYGMADLVRVARSFGLGRRRLRAEIERHCGVLGCSTGDAPSHLLASLGHLSSNLEHFPPERFARLVETCYAALADAVA